MFKRTIYPLIEVAQRVLDKAQDQGPVLIMVGVSCTAPQPPRLKVFICEMGGKVPALFTLRYYCMTQMRYLMSKCTQKTFHIVF